MLFPYQEFKEVKRFVFKKMKLNGGIVVIPENNVESLISVNQNNVDSLRKELTKIVFGYPYLPDSQPDTIHPITDNVYNDVENLDYIERFEITQKNDIQSIGYIFHPEESNGRLMLYHQGHGGDFSIGKKAINQFIKEGFTIYAFCMPLLGKNNRPLVKINHVGTIRLSSHDHLIFLDNPIQYFIYPVVTMINYSLEKKFDDITMVGFSGGGWTTSIVSAIDSRVNYSFIVSGSIPLFVKFNLREYVSLDFEGKYEGIYKKMSHLDIFVLGAVGVNRLQTQILTSEDPCCNDGRYYKHYFSTVESAVNQFDHGKFNIVIDNTHRHHKMSKLAIMKISETLSSTR